MIRPDSSWRAGMAGTPASSCTAPSRDGMAPAEGTPGDRVQLTGVSSVHDGSEILFGAMDKLVRSLAPEKMTPFMTDSTIQKIRSGLSLMNLMSPWPTEKWKVDFPRRHQLPVGIPDKDGTDVKLFSKREGVKGLSMLDDDIFIESYFREKCLNGMINQPGHSVTLTSHQPWLQWNAVNQSYNLHEDGAQQALLNKLLNKTRENHVRLYRGLTKPCEEGILRVPRQLCADRILSMEERVQLADRLETSIMTWKQDADAARWENLNVVVSDEVLNELQGRMAEMRSGTPMSLKAQQDLGHSIGSLITRGNRELRKDSVFMTPDIERARHWGRNGVIELDVPKEQLKQWSENHEIYVGIETGLELSLISSEAQDYLLTNWNKL